MRWDTRALCALADMRELGSLLTSVRDANRAGAQAPPHCGYEGAAVGHCRRAFRPRWRRSELHLQTLWYGDFLCLSQLWLRGARKEGMVLAFCAGISRADF